MSRRNKCIGLSVGVILGLVIIAAIVIAVVLTTKKGTQKQPEYDSRVSPLDFFNTSDALAVKWYHGANSLQQLSEAANGDYMMIEADIILRWRGYTNETNEPVMAHPPKVDSDNTLDNWLNELLKRKDKGLKLDFKSLKVIKPSLELLKTKKNKIRHPIWANADIVTGPKGRATSVINAEQFLKTVNDVYPKMTLSVGWTTGCCDVMFDREMMQSMLEKVKDASQPLTFPARAKLLKGSWEEFKWLLNQTGSTSSITVWTPAGRNDWEDTDMYDLLYVRNDIDKKYIYYDLPGPRFDAFRRLCVTAGSPLNHFDLPGRDALHITWAHAVNSKADVEKAIQDNVMFFEADVILRGGTDTPVMAHPPANDSDITLKEWVQKVGPTQKGIKLDFKSVDVLQPAMEVLNETKQHFNQPVWLNADIFTGPNTNKPGVNATEFRRIILANFPESTLSIGWTTSWNSSENATNSVYTQEMIDEMASYCETLKQPVTFPIRAAMARRSWSLLRGLLDRSRAYTITIWSSKSDNVDPDDMVYVRKNSEISRVYYDLPEPLMSEFKKRIGYTT